ncbi:MAG: MFS transporter [Ferruginibacter sp.]
MTNIIAKSRMSLGQIINMNVGFFGIQYSFGLQQNAINPLYTFLDAQPESLPILNLAGPITGLLVQPIIGAMSDKTWHPKWGRRKPYFLIGAVFCSICLFLFPFSSSLWMAAGLLWVLDAANNTAMEPYRAFVADRLPAEQQALGFLSQSFFTGFGITLAAASLWIFKQLITGQTSAGIPYWVFGSFFVGAICSIVSVLWSVIKTPELPPDEEELKALRSESKSVLTIFKDIFAAIRDMPLNMRKLVLVYLFQWYAMMCYWQFISHSVAKSVWGVTSKSNPPLYEDAVAWTGLINSFYNIVTFICAFSLVGLAKKFGASDGTCRLSFLCSCLPRTAAIHRQQIPAVCPDDWFGCSLGQYDGRSLYHCSRKHSGQTLWRLYGDCKYADRCSDDHPEPQFRFRIYEPVRWKPGQCHSLCCHVIIPGGTGNAAHQENPAFAILIVLKK